MDQHGVSPLGLGVLLVFHLAFSSCDSTIGVAGVELLAWCPPGRPDRRRTRNRHRSPLSAPGSLLILAHRPRCRRLRVCARDFEKRGKVGKRLQAASSHLCSFLGQARDASHRLSNTPRSHLGLGEAGAALSSTPYFCFGPNGELRAWTAHGANAVLTLGDNRESSVRSPSWLLLDTWVLTNSVACC